jgi:hypothetical protein
MGVAVGLQDLGQLDPVAADVADEVAQLGGGSDHLELVPNPGTARTGGRPLVATASAHGQHDGGGQGGGDDDSTQWGRGAVHWHPSGFDKNDNAFHYRSGGSDVKSAPSGDEGGSHFTKETEDPSINEDDHHH